MHIVYDKPLRKSEPELPQTCLNGNTPDKAQRPKPVAFHSSAGAGRSSFELEGFSLSRLERLPLQVYTSGQTQGKGIKLFLEVS